MSASLSSEGLRTAADTVRRLTGLVFPESRRGALERAVVAAMGRAGAAGPEDYLARLAAEGELLDDLAAEITIGESYFFRDPDQIAHLAEEIIAPAVARSDERPLRIWSAGCASGEEPYSLAIALMRLGLLSRVRILATDISRSALAKARRGRYTAWSLRGVGDDVIAAFFRRERDEYVLAPGIREAVELRYLNLAEDTYPSLATGVWGMDLVVCRNVLIYFDADTVTRVVRRLLDSLGETGWLILGASDPVIADRAPCEAVVSQAGLVYRRAGARPPAPDRWVSSPSTPAPQVKPATFTPVPEPCVTTPPPPLQPAVAAPAAPVGGAGAADAVSPSEDAAAIAAVRALANAGRLAEAGRACAAALDRHGLSAELLYLHAVLLSEGGHPGEAIVAARRALYLDRGLVVAHLVLGESLARMGGRREARRAFRNAERLLAAMPADGVVPASDGEPAGRLLEMVRAELLLLREAAA